MWVINMCLLFWPEKYFACCDIWISSEKVTEMTAYEFFFYFFPSRFQY